MVFLILLLPFSIFASDFTTMPKPISDSREEVTSFEKDFMSNSESYQKSMDTYSNCMSQAETKNNVTQCNNERRQRNTILYQEKQRIRSAINLKRKKDQLEATISALKNGEIKVEKTN